MFVRQARTPFEVWGRSGSNTYVFIFPSPFPLGLGSCLL